MSGPRVGNNGILKECRVIGNTVEALASQATQRASILLPY